MAKTYTISINKEAKSYIVKPPLARGSYMQSIHEPQGFDDNDDKSWGCQLRWPLDDEETRQWAGEMINLFKIMIGAKWGDDKVEQILKSCRLPLRNGDNEEREQYHGWLFMNVRNKFKQPVILGPTAQPLSEEMITPEYIYSGAWYRSRLSFFTYDQKGKGISAGLQVLMKLKDDDRLDGGITADEASSEFSEFADPNAGMDIGSDELTSDDTDNFNFL